MAAHAAIHDFLTFCSRPPRIFYGNPNQNRPKIPMRIRVTFDDALVAKAKFCTGIA